MPLPTILGTCQDSIISLCEIGTLPVVRVVDRSAQEDEVPLGASILIDRGGPILDRRARFRTCHNLWLALEGVKHWQAPTGCATNIKKRRRHVWNTGWYRVAHGWRSIWRGILCAHREGKEMAMGDHLGGGRLFLLDCNALVRELPAAPSLWCFLSINYRACALRSGPTRRHVGCRQCQLRTHDALFGGCRWELGWPWGSPSWRVR